MDATQDIEFQESLVLFANDDDCPHDSVQHFLQIIWIILMGWPVPKRMVQKDNFNYMDNLDR